MTNTNSLTLAINAITTEHSEVLLRLTTLDEKYKAERLEIVSQLTPLAKALEALTGKSKDKPAGSDGKVRRPMSAEGKENIRKALEARKARLAGETPTETPSVPSEPSQEQSEPVKADGVPPVKGETVDEQDSRFEAKVTRLAAAKNTAKKVVADDK